VFTSPSGCVSTSTAQPPVNNKQMWERTGDFIVQVVGGPNQRTDFHVDPYEEWFYQVKGNMHVDVVTDEGPRTVHINEGDMWLLAGERPALPQRPEPGSIGVVIERIRRRARWRSSSGTAELPRAGARGRVAVRDIVADLPPVFQAFYADDAARTCGSCGTLHPGKG